MEKTFSRAEQLDLRVYMEQMALLLELPIPPQYRAGVLENLENIAAIAHLVTEFTLPDEIEPAPTFNP